MRRILPLLALPSILAAQAPDAWQQVVDRRMQGWRTPVVSSFALFFPKSMNGQWQAADEFVRLRVSGELGFPMLDEAEEKALKTRMAWGPEPRWILLNPKGEPVGNGTEPPTPDQIRPLMEATGWRSRWDRRADFLRVNPASGDAWADELRELGRFVGRQAFLIPQIAAQKKGAADADLPFVDPDKAPTDPALDQTRWGPMSKALHGLMEVDGWTGWNSLGFTASALRIGGAKGSGVLKPEFEKLRRGAESALRRRPSGWSLWEAWSVASAMGELGDPETLLSSLEPAPRQPWPPLNAAPKLAEAFIDRQDWAGLERLSARALDQALTPGLMSGKNTKEHRAEALAAWVPARVMCLLHLQREEDALAAASQAHVLAGSSWRRLSELIGSWAKQPEAREDPDGKPRRVELPPALIEILKREPVPDPAAPGLPPPLTLALVGEPAWAPAFRRLKDASALDPWEPGEELAFGVMDAKQAQRLRARFGWGTEAHWVLLWGEEVLDSGAQLPDSRGLADRLRAQGTPFLEQLNAFLRRHPDQEEARQARLDELLSRMPNARLEATLLEDAKALRAPFLEGSGKDWKPMKEVWEPAALRLLPELEAGLRSWPEDERRWLAYADWSSLHPRRPSPADLLATLPIWKTRARGGAGPLPDEVGTAVATRLRQQERWEALAAWGRAFWEGGLRDQLREDLRSGRKPAAVAARWFLLEKQLIQPFGEALSHLGKQAELRALDQDLKDLRPALALRRKQVPKEGN